MNIISIDIGGSKIKRALVKVKQAPGIESYKAGQVYAVPTKSRQGVTAITSQLFRSIEAYLKNFDVPLIAVSTAGTVDWDSGKITYATDALPGFSGLELAELLSRRYSRRVVVINDAVAALIGEAYLLPQPEGTMILTLGTGLGCAQVKYAYPLDAGSCVNLPLAHVEMNPGGRPCTCGKQGCAEQYASATAIRKNNDGKPINFAEAITPAEQKALDLFCEDFAQVVLVAQRTYSPSSIVVGGGISEAGEYWWDYFLRCFKEMGGTVPVQLATHGNAAGIIGAAFAAQTGVFKHQ